MARNTWEARPRNGRSSNFSGKQDRDRGRLVRVLKATYCSQLYQRLDVTVTSLMRCVVAVKIECLPRDVRSHFREAGVVTSADW